MKAIPFRPEASERYWYGGVPFVTLYWEALSLLFPAGEAFFVRTVHHFLPTLTGEALVARVRCFVAQEATHASAHARLNATLEDSGLPAKRLQARCARLLDLVARLLSPRWQLAVTCALEHFTALFGEALLLDAAHRARVHPAMRPAWIWHATEETEHKSVALDVYRATGGTEWVRCLVMAGTTVVFVLVASGFHLALLAADGQLGALRRNLEGLRLLWGPGGLLLRMVPGWARYFRPGYHPDERDTSALVAEWTRVLKSEG